MRLSAITPCLLACALAVSSPASAQPAQFVIVNINAAGVGFNDPTVAAPVGGNAGTTLGQQRLIAFERAASLWAQRLNSAVPIRIRAQFTALGAGVLGSAGPATVVRDFPNAPLPGTWYAVALANSLAGEDLIPASPTFHGDDINANFSTNFNFYLGLDNHAPAGQPDLVAVLLHEFAHGLGFLQTASLTTGALLSGFPDGYNTKLFDLVDGKYWPQMNNTERFLSATRFGRVVLDASRVTADVPQVLLFGSPDVSVLSPAGIAGPYQFGTAAFGPRVGNPNVQGSVVAAVDGIEPPATVGGAPGTTTDGCSPFSNAAAVSGNIVLIERGFCGFAVKARNATNAGATAVIIYNNAANGAGAPPGMADDGINGAFVTIPTISFRRVDGIAILTQVGVTASIAVDPTLRAGADAQNRAKVYAPNPVVGGSSISHYDPIAFRNVLMEPAINADLTHKLKAPDDLTSELLYDIGWKFPDADADGVVNDEDCNPNSDMRSTIVLGRVDTGVRNHLFENGCTMSDQLTTARSGAATLGDYVSAVAALTNQWVSDGLMTGAEKGVVTSVAARTGTN